EGALAAARAEAEGLRQELDQAQAAAQDLRQKNAALTAARAESQADAEAERADLAEITAEKDTAQHRLGDLEGALAAARAEAEGLRQELDQAWAKCRELEDWIETSKVQHGAALAKAAETASSTQRARTKAEEDLTLALRLQGLRETDLDELKDRYRALKAENDQLADLLRTTLHSLTFLQGKKQGGKKTAKRT
ncbi:hypothetical protein, partial [Ponticoccus sp. (in: a-proteobacteria)]|uniref:hypothetical protein n=1 Tax=Ponticoccus sp. (in: a-proteobacteria) TaxID=1925025 RepID=UPI003AB7ACE3